MKKATESPIRGIIRGKKATESAIKGGISSIRLPNDENTAKCKENARRNCKTEFGEVEEKGRTSGGPAECAKPSKGILPYLQYLP